MQIPFTFFSELKSPGQVIVLSFSSRNVWIYSKPGVNFPLDVMTAPDTTDPTLLISCSSKGWKLKHGGVLLFTILASMSLHRNVRNSHNLPTLLENSKLSQKIQNCEFEFSRQKIVILSKHKSNNNWKIGLENSNS